MAEKQKNKKGKKSVKLAVSETDEFVSCDDGAAGEKDQESGKLATELDMAAINVDVTGPAVPSSTKNKVPKLNFQGALDHGSGKPETPTGKSGRDMAAIHLPTMDEESDFADDPMNLGHMTTTGNVSHDSASMRDAEQKFRDLLAGDKADDSQQPENRESIIETESEASPEKTTSTKMATLEQKEESKTISINLKPTEQPEEEADKKQASLDGEQKGANIVIEDSHRSAAIEIFESYFARAFKRKDNAPMNEKRFMRAIERAKKREHFDEAYVAQFQLLFRDASKDEEGRMSAESLIDAIVVMIEKQDAEIQEDNQNSAASSKVNPLDQVAPQNSLQRRANLIQKNPLAAASKNELRDELFTFFETFQKEFYASSGPHENRVHLNLQELRDTLIGFDNLLMADENAEKSKDVLLLELLCSITPRSEMFIGKHGTSLMTLNEFTKIVEEAYMADQLQLKVQQAALLDDSIDFYRDAGQIVVESSASQSSPLLTDRNLRSAMQEDAKNLVERFNSTYKECTENTSMVQVTEMLEYLVNENQHEALGVSPSSLQTIFELLREKNNAVRLDYDELDSQKEQFKEINMLRQYCQEIENDKERLQAFEQSFLEAKDEIKAIELKLLQSQKETQNLQPLLQKNDDLNHKIQTLQIGLEEKDFKYKALQEDLRIAERQLERLENQNRVFDSESLSDDTSDEETKRERSRVSHASSMDDSAGDIVVNSNHRGSITSNNNRSRMSDGAGANNNTRANTTAKSNDSVTDSSNYKALQESLDSFGQGDSDSIKARSDVLQFANKVLSEKMAMAKQLDHLKDKQRALKSKNATLEDKNGRLNREVEANNARIEKHQKLFKKKDFEVEEMKLALSEFQKSINNINVENKRLQASNQELERKIKAERAERMSMSNNSFVSQGLGTGRFGGGGGGAKDILSMSIMENSMAGKGNTSIMDIMTGHAAPSMKEMQNRSLMISKPRESSFCSSQKSFFSKKPKELMAKKKQSAQPDDNKMLIDDDSFSDCSDGGVIRKVEAFSDENSDASESDDCVIETETKVKSTGFFQKLKLRDIMKQKNMNKVQTFREGESDEYNSEVDGEPSFDAPQVNYDILGIRDGKVADKPNQLHTIILDLVLKYEELPEDVDDVITFDNHRRALQKESDEAWRERNGLNDIDGQDGEDDSAEEEKEREPRPLVNVNDITRDFLSCDQSFIFSDELIIFDSKIIETVFAIVDQKVYILYKDTKKNVYTPFDLEELAAIVMSPSNPMSAAFRMKDCKKLNRSHIVFQNQNMGLMIRFIQELEAYWLSVEFNDQIAMTIDNKPVSFNFKDIALEKQKAQNDGLVNCAAQGYLFKKKHGFAAFWRDMFSETNWESGFYVLTNVGILVFEEENFSNPTRLISLSKLNVTPVSQKTAGMPFAFNLVIEGEDEEIMLRAPDRPQFDNWMKSLRELISEVKKKPQNFKIAR